MLIIRKLKQSFIWASLLVLASTTLIGIIPSSKAVALSEDGRSRIIASGLAFCLYDGLAFKEDNGEYNNSITDYWEEEGNREIVAVGLSIDSGDGMITCNQVIDNLGPVATALGLNGTTTTELRESLEELIIGDYAGPGTVSAIKDFAGGIDGQDFEDRAKSFAHNEIADYVNSLTLTDTDLAERLLPVVNFCFEYQDEPYANHADHYFEDAVQADGRPIYVEWKDDPWKDIAAELGLSTHEGVSSATDVEISGIIETGYDDDNLDDGADRRYQWRFFPLGYDMLLRNANNGPTFEGNSGELYDTYALASCKTIEENYKNRIFKEYILNADGELTIGGKTLSELIDADNIEDPDFNLANGDDNPSCEGADALGWIMCPIIGGLLGMNDLIFRNFLVPFLEVDPINTNEGIVFSIWSSFRTLGNVLLVFGLLFIVFGQTIGGGLVDAYTAKKAMPRIFIAAILINISIYIVAFMVDMGNILGSGIGQIITAPLEATGNNQYRVNGAITSVVLIGVVLSFGLVFVLIRSIQKDRSRPNGERPFTKALLYTIAMIAVPAVLVVMGIFFTLVIRLGLILFLAVVSPVALALFVMPSTDKYSKKWLEAFIKTILVYPIIVTLFAIAEVLSVLLSSGVPGPDIWDTAILILGSTAILAAGIPGLLAGTALIGGNLAFNEGSGEAFLLSLISIVVLFIPLALIPFSFKLAGGIMGSLLGAVVKGRLGADKLIRGDKHAVHGRYVNTMGKITRLRAEARDSTLENINHDASGTHGVDAEKTSSAGVAGPRTASRRRRTFVRPTAPSVVVTPTGAEKPTSGVGTRDTSDPRGRSNPFDPTAGTPPPPPPPSAPTPGVPVTLTPWPTKVAPTPYGGRRTTIPGGSQPLPTEAEQDINTEMQERFGTPKQQAGDNKDDENA